MNTRDLLSLCARNLLRRRTRTVLAVIGVVVGVCAIIVMLSIGFGLTESYSAMISSYGNLHLIELYNYSSGSEKGVINAKSLEEISAIDGVGAVTPIINTYGVIRDETTERQVQTSIYGVDTAVLKKFNYKTQEGTLLKKTEPYGILFGNQIVSWFTDPESDTWEEYTDDVMNGDLYITMNSNYGYNYDWIDQSKMPDYPIYEAKAVGVLANANDESAYSVYMDINTVEQMNAEAQEAEEGTDWEGNHGSDSSGIGPNKTYQRAWVYVDDIQDTESVSETLRDMDFQTYSSSDWLNQAKQTLALIELVLGGIGGISLFVAAIGIANTMVMSVYERTKEIGIMKVIGANLKDIRNMFLVEAGMIGLSGGIIGILLSLAISFAMNHFLSGMMSGILGFGGEGTVVSIVPLWLILAALGFSFLVGVVAGFSPANKAMKASALNALRNE